MNKMKFLNKLLLGSNSMRMFIKVLVVMIFIRIFKEILLFPLEERILEIHYKVFDFTTYVFLTAGVVYYFLRLMEKENDLNAENQRKIENIACIDCLTSAYNRKGLNRELNRIITKGNNIGKKMTVTFLDLDDFKEVNDNYGHQVGDELLKMLSCRIQHYIKRDDILCRLGGDEFIIISITNNEETINELLNIIATPYEIGNNIIKISASLGVYSVIINNHLDIDDIVAKADETMYQAKKSGKNKCIFLNSQ